MSLAVDGKNSSKTAVPSSLGRSMAAKEVMRNAEEMRRPGRAGTYARRMARFKVKRALSAYNSLVRMSNIIRFRR